VRAVAVTAYGGPEVLEFRGNHPDPEPAEGQVLVDVNVAGVNYRDVYERITPGYVPFEPPFVAGTEGAGVVPQTGERVAWNAVQGSYAEQVAADPNRLVPIPDEIDDETAAAGLLQGMTAHYLSHSTFPIQDGDDVLIHAGAGGVGLLLIQMAKMCGARVITTTSTDAKAELASEAGADDAIVYDDFATNVKTLTDGRGVAAVYDGVGKDTFDASLASLRPRGMLVLFGAASGQPPPLELGRLAGGGSLFVTRPTLVHYTLTREEHLRRASDVFTWIAEGRLDVRIGDRYPLEEARQAQEDLEARRTTGKLLLTVR
jgi:NADPH2:quinone reductase